jgi:hypothetical protein
LVQDGDPQPVKSSSSSEDSFAVNDRNFRDVADRYVIERKFILKEIQTLNKYVPCSFIESHNLN